VLHTEDGKKTEIIDGMGNPELDVIAFTDAVRNAILDPDLSSKGIVEAYKQRCGTDESGFIDRYIDRVLIWAWLRAAKTQVGKDISQEGLPYHGAQLKQAEFIPPGPSRTRPFRSIVRVALELPGEENYAFSKIPAVFEQRIDLRPRSQYDGSIGDPVTRSFIAAYASGASLVSLSKPEMVDNIRNAAGFTEELGISIAVQRFEELFPNNVPDPVQVEAGLLVYQQHCTECHGYRPTDGDRAWVAEGDKLHQFSPIGAPDDMNAIGTDPERVTFRYNDLLALGLTTTLPGRADNLEKQRDSLKAAQKMAREEGQPAVAYFWSRQLERLNLSARQFRLGHPLYFPETTLKDEVAFINNPIPYAYLRAPYLHNGSIPNMRQLINLDPRPPAFCRGNNIYDPDSMGFITATPDSSGACPTGQSFLFDTGVRGNSNAGHDYPWKRDSPNWNEEALLNLLAYLKTL
jgi:mono/diheme cytochrome c family protein